MNATSLICVRKALMLPIALVPARTVRTRMMANAMMGPVALHNIVPGEVTWLTVRDLDLRHLTEVAAPVLPSLQTVAIFRETYKAVEILRHGV